MGCQWCHDRRGGCLYCAGEEDAQEIIEDLQWRIDSGEVEVVEVAVVHHQAFVLRHRGGRPNRPAPIDNRRPECRSHRWVFDPPNFLTRHCSNPGCGARQRWVWLPEDTRRQGEWQDLDGVPVISTQRRKGARALRKETA